MEDSTIQNGALQTEDQKTSTAEPIIPDTTGICDADAEGATGNGVDSSSRSDVVDSFDPEFSASLYQFVAFEQREEAGDHYLRINNNHLTTDGKRDDPATKFKVHITDSPSFHCVVVLEGIQASEENQPSLISMNRQKDRLELVKKQKSITRLREIAPSLLFNLKTKSANNHDVVFFESHEGKDHHCIGFSPKGEPLSPSKVTSDMPISWFNLVECF